MNEPIETPDETELPENLKAVLKRAKKRAKTRSLHTGIFALLMFFVLLPALKWISISGSRAYNALAVATMLIFEFSSFGFLFLHSLKGGYGLNFQDLSFLRSLDDKRVLFVVLEVRFEQLNKKCSTLRNDLMRRWLPLLTLEDLQSLTPLQKKQLVYLLQYASSDVKLAILRTLGQAGDRGQILPLKLWQRRLLGWPPKPEVKAAYQSCVAAIEARLAAGRTDAQLLRPSSSSEGNDHLLRPSSAPAREVMKNTPALERKRVLRLQAGTMPPDDE